MSESENNRFKTKVSRSNRKTFDRKRKRSSGLDEPSKLKAVSQYMQANNKMVKIVEHEAYESTALNNGSDVQAPIQTSFNKGAVEILLKEYENLRLQYQSEGISQSSILLMQRMAREINSDESYQSVDQLPILKELLNISTTLMFNDFEIIIWMIWLRMLTLPEDENMLVDFIQMMALFVKQDNNQADHYNIYDNFYAHNHPEFYEKFKSQEKPQIILTSSNINEYYKQLTKTFEYKQEKELKDYNFEVDALEAEHDKRDVHTTTKFDEEKLQKMKEEADRSNKVNNHGKKSNIKAEPKVEKEPKMSVKKRSKKETEKIKQEVLNKRDSFITFDRNSSKNSSNENPITSKNVGFTFVPPSFDKGKSSGIIPFSSSRKIPSGNPFNIGSIGNLGIKNQSSGGDIFKNYLKSKDNNRGSEYIKFPLGLLANSSNPNSADIGSINCQIEDIKNGKLGGPNNELFGSFHSNIPMLSKKDSNSLILRNLKSGSYEGKIQGFKGERGSFANVTK